jgi:hypothetical protein
MKIKTLFATIIIISLATNRGICGYCTYAKPKILCSSEAPHWASPPVLTECGGHYFNIGTYHLGGDLYFPVTGHDADTGSQGDKVGEAPKREMHTYYLGLNCQLKMTVSFESHPSCSGYVPDGDPCPIPPG